MRISAGCGSEKVAGMRDQDPPFQTLRNELRAPVPNTQSTLSLDEQVGV